VGFRCAKSPRGRGERPGGCQYAVDRRPAINYAMDHAAMLGGLFTRTWRPGARRGAIVFLHGLGDSGASFALAAARPGIAEWQVLAPDLPGYDRSPCPVPPPSLFALADQIAVWIGAAAAAPAILIGHSMGGTLAQLIAERHPAVAQALINVEGNLCLDDCWLSGLIAASPVAEFAPEGRDRLVVRMREVGETAYAANLSRCDPVACHQHARDLVALSTPGDLARRLAALPIPVLYVAGSPRGVGPTTLAYLHDAGVSVATIAPAGHSPFIDQPQPFVAAIAGVLG
jgi:pimeloyl-ACP methyl ester carboxylesterase